MRTGIQKCAEIFLITVSGTFAFSNCTRAPQSKIVITAEPAQHFTERQLEDAKLEKELVSLEHEQKTADLEIQLSLNEKALREYIRKHRTQTRASAPVERLKMQGEELKAKIAKLKNQGLGNWEVLEAEINSKMKEFTNTIQETVNSKNNK